MSIQDSIKARLRNRAIRENRTFQEILTIYSLERMLYRLSISKYSKHYVLKGGILLYAMYKGNYKRGTADVDLLGQSLTNDLKTIQDSFIEILNLSCEEDGISYDISTVKATRITEFKKYPGINISIDGYISKTKISIQIDVGFGDVVSPEIEIMDYPTLLDLPAPIVQIYSKESIIAEKFQAIVSLGYANSRMKDFYDIYALLNTFDFEYSILKEAIKETFNNRNTSFDQIVAFEGEYANDPYRKNLWLSFMKAKKIEIKVEFDSVIDSIKIFLKPVIDGGLQLNLIWNHNRLVWM